MLNQFRLNPTLSILSAASFGVIIGWIDLHASEVQPRRAWLSALIIGGSILIAHLLGLAVGFEPYPVEPNVFATLIALIPAFIGAYIGALIGWSMQKPH